MEERFIELEKKVATLELEIKRLRSLVGAGLLPTAINSWGGVTPAIGFHLPTENQATFLPPNPQL